MEALYRLEEAGVAELRAAITDPPSYSAVRALLAELVRKKQAVFRQDGKRYVYRPKRSREAIAKKMLKGLVSNFFHGRPSEAICTLLQESRLTEEDLERIKQHISQAEMEADDD